MLSQSAFTRGCSPEALRSLRNRLWFTRIQMASYKYIGNMVFLLRFANTGLACYDFRDVQKFLCFIIVI
jgi:hypothetical protein